MSPRSKIGKGVIYQNVALVGRIIPPPTQPTKQKMSMPYSLEAVNIFPYMATEILQMGLR